MATLPATVPDLWPELKYEVLAPRTILERQAAYLRARGSGVLAAEVTTVTVEPDTFIHRLDLIAVQLDGMRVRILTATHRMEYYPVQVEAECFKPKRRSPAVGFAGMDEFLRSLPKNEDSGWPPAAGWQPVAWDQDAFIAKVGEVLKSGEARSVMESIIARSNERQLLADPSAA